MSEITDILAGVEGLAPEAISAIETYLKSKEAEFTAAAEAKYGIKPSVVSDVTAVASDVAPALEKVPGVQALLDRINALEAQTAALKSHGAENVTEASNSGGDPVPHTLFLADGSVVQNHAGLATHYSTTNADGTESVRKVVAAYPS